MAIFHKNRTPDSRPRCEAKTPSGTRCKFHGSSYVDVAGSSVFVCSKHAAVAKKGGTA